MARTRSVDFLPEIFQTSTNRQVLGATLDQLVQEPKIKRIQGFVGRKVGPGVNPNDKYVTEQTATRVNYQLEPGVVFKTANDTNKIKDAITYPGITDALQLQGALVDNADRLYTSEYYAWDPFVDFDKFINYSQYYWLPAGPDAVQVFSETVPTTDNFVVTRANGVYTFSGVSGENPALTLVRGGSYTFQVAQNATETVNFRVSNQGTSAWVIDYVNNPTLTLVRGNTYVFNLVPNIPLPFYIKTQATLGTTNQYTDGVTGNGNSEGNITFVVPETAPDTLFYVSPTLPNMQGQINVIDGQSGTGPGFWIQTDPGVNGQVPGTPNISSRDVLGVVNNGEDLGTVTFDVPLSTAQDFFYTLTPIAYNSGKVDIICDLQFDQLNNVSVSEFLQQFPNGIDGISDINGRTLIFTETNTDPETGGWLIRSPYSPLDDDRDNDGLPGSYDSLPYDETTPITSVATQRSVWLATYSGDPEVGQVIQLTSVYEIDPLEKFAVQFGTQWASTSWYKDAGGEFEKIPLLTAVRDRLYYQDGTDSEIFGTIKLIDQNQSSTLDINDIIGAKNYTSPNGVTFTNGLKVTFIGSVIPASFANQSFYVEGVGTGPGITARVGFVDGQAYYGPFHVHEGQKMVGAYHVNTFHQYIYDTVEQSLANAGAGAPAGAPIGNTSVPSGVTATGIKLLPVGEFVTPETYTESATIPYDSIPYDVGNYDGSLNQPLRQDYITINRASPDLNAWTRSNRWFHGSVIQQAAEYNNTVPVLDNAARGRRPILEFRSGLRLFNFGTAGKQPVDIVDFSATDALSTINGTTGYGVDGYTFITGTRVIFAADTDPQVRNQIYEVEFITPDTVPPEIAQPIINLVPASDAEVRINDTVVSLSGITQQGLSFWFDGVDWIPAQQKTSINQPPLFDIYDQDGVSLADQVKYPASNFTGNKLFSYATAGNLNDTVLGFPLRYLSLANIGDIVFDNNLYTDTFTYTINNSSVTNHVSDGFVREYVLRTVFARDLGWQTAPVPSRARQQFQFTYDGNPLQLDVAVLPDHIIPSVQVFVGSRFQEANTYTVATTADSTLITLDAIHAPGDTIEVAVLSDQTSKVAFYQVPINLENNPLNVNSAVFTLGTVRSHYETICQNLLEIQGPINGSNNTRDLGNIIPFGTNIIQNSSPMTLAGYFMRSAQYNIFSALEYNSREYEQYKSQLLNNVITNDYTNLTIPEMLTAVVNNLVAGRTQLNPFYWTDMLPASTVYTETVITYTPISTPTFNLNTTYDFTSSNYQGLLVYVNDVILQAGTDYEVSPQGPVLTILIPLAVGDVISIQEYSATYGTFVPNTPTKLGLYPAYRPRIYLDTTYINPTLVIQGHDGSKTIAFGDFRDDLLLEFETRIYNNLKIKSLIPLTEADVTPGQFRTTDYSLSEINDILAPSFLSWIGWNKLAYTQQDYIANNEFSWNYSATGNRISATNSALETPMPVGAWRGLYEYFYDTASPQSTPWEMLGFSEEPDWWQDEYGPAPYTSGNLVLWDDLAQGRVADPAGAYILPKYRRPGLQQIIPVDSEGQLLSPFYSVVGLYDSSQFQKSWVFGDQGPVEYSWRASSAYPFAIMRLLALTRPAEFFSLFADRDLYKYDPDLGQYLYNQRYRLDANGIQVYGNGVSKASFIDWIVDYNQQLGRDSTTQLTEDLSLLDVRLCYRMGTFTDKQYLKIFAEKSSPNSQNSTLLLPDESYNLLLYKNQPFGRVIYSSVILQVVDGGYAVFGYSVTQPYFEILASRTAGARRVVSAGGTTVTVPATYSQDVVQIPYGYVFTNDTVVVDFLLSYGALLQSQGLIFDDRENGYALNWDQMAQEFLYWANQGWATGAVINLNPTATSLTAVREQAVVDSIIAQTPENLILDQNRLTIPARELVVDRFENQFKVSTLNQQTISYLDLRYTSYENMVVLDNVSVFNDLIYNPATGARQSRVNISAAVSAEWNGQLDAQGFILNNDNTVEPWQSLKKYAKGEIVLYKNKYYSAQTIVQPAIEFRYSDWVESDYTKIQRGLLQNIPNLADQLASTYAVNQANLEQEQDLFAYGLIGFRPRQYMTDLNLDDVSQVNVYKQFLKDKGTIRSVRLLGNADLGKETAQYNVFENWAILRGTYGATANRRFIEMRLNAGLLVSDPSLVQIIQPQQTSAADQAILYTDLWRESYKVNSANIFPTTTVQVTDTALPSAGYVNFEDVDVTVFSLDAELGLAPGVLDTIGIGTTIWAAKSNRYDWNIYRSTGVPGFVNSASSNLDGTATVTFSQAPELVVDDIIIIRFFDPAINGIYRVLALPDLRSIVIQLRTNTFSSATGAGLAYNLQTMRVSQASDVLTLPYSQDLVPGARVWVDNNGAGQWEVLEKVDPFTPGLAFTPLEPTVSPGYGKSLAQGFENLMALVGAPDYATTGAVYPYLRGFDNEYVQNPVLLLGATDTLGYGNSVDIGRQNYAVAGASLSNSGAGYAAVIFRARASNSFVESQLLVAPDLDFGSGEFGHSVTISEDERWMYIGAPGNNKVYAYGRVDQPVQSVQFQTNGTQTVYSIAGLIEFDNEEQLSVILNNQLLTLNTDYAVNGTVIALASTPLAGLRLTIARKIAQIFTGDGSTTEFDLEPYLYTADNIYSFTVYVNNVIQRPELDYDFNSDSAALSFELVFETAPALNARIEVVASTYWQYIDVISAPTLASAARFGSSVSTTTDGRQVMIGAINDSADLDHPQAGAVYVYDRSVTRYVVDNDTQTSYALPVGFQEPVAVVLNNQYLTNSAQYINGQFSISGNDVVLSTAPAVGDVLELESNIFRLVQKLTASAPFDEADFGATVDVCPNNCSIYTGAPVDGTVLTGAGSVQRNVNQSRVYGTTTSGTANPSLTAGNTIRINNTPVAVPAVPLNTVAGLQAAIVAAGIPNVTATVADGLLTISVVNVQAADEFNRLTVLPGVTGTAFADLDFDTYKFTQTITSPRPSANANFGAAVNIDSSAQTLIVGAPGGDLYQAETFDRGTTLFDDRSTTFSTTVLQSGVAYSFDYLPSATDSANNPGKFVFGTQIYDSNIQPLDKWGTAVNYRDGKLLIGSPGSDLGDSSGDFGRVKEFNNADRARAWSTLRLQQPVVDVRLLNSVYMYDKLQNSTTNFFDFFDPLQGKILGAARQNINYIGAIDPAKYNFGPINNDGNFWGADRVGEIWWNTDSVRFIDPNQDDITYASRRWGQTFPGSRIEIYQWTASAVPPANYTGPGTVNSTASYTIKTSLSSAGTFETTYYFWVTGLTTINTSAGKTLSTTGIARYIEDPRSSGIPYLACLNASTVAIYNGLQFLSATDTILHIEFDQTLNDANVHQEYQLIAQDKPESFLAPTLYKKLQDSFSGYDISGAAVPDPFLSPPEQYGVQFSPRQSMFENRFVALQNYLNRANSILKYLPIVELRRFSLLNSREPVPAPSTNLYNRVLDTIEQLSFQNLNSVPLGYAYLVLSDTTNQGRWAIYTVILESAALGAPRTTQLSRVQSYDTRNYWNYVDWYQLGYNPNTIAVAEVPNYASLATLTSVPVGASVRVTANAQNKFEVYVRTALGWDRVGLQDGTIEFSAELYDYALGGYGFDVEPFDARYYDQEPVEETRKIIQAINQELFIDDLAINRNRLLILMFEYILTEQEAPEWLTKTSLIDVRHEIRALLPFQTYRQDNQDFVLDYIQEVKPYHVQVKQFNLVYNGINTYPGSLTDFDCPAYYNTNLTLPQYVSPILLPYTKSTAIGTGTASDVADTASDAQIWTQIPWSDWLGNYLLSLQQVSVAKPGSGYTEAPVVIVGTAWQADTVLDLGQQIFHLTNLYTVMQAGTTGNTAPVFDTGTETNGTTVLAFSGVAATAEAVINGAGQVAAVTIIQAGSGYTTAPIITLVGGTGSGAVAYAVMGNDLVRDIKTTIKYDRYQYSTDITDWSYAVATYPQGTQVRYINRVWQANDTVNNPAVTTTATGTAGNYTFAVASVAGLSTGMLAVGFGIPEGSVITAVSNTGTTVTLNFALTSTIASRSVSFYMPFLFDLWTEVQASTLSGIDRTQGFYVPTVNMPGRSLPLLIDGLEYPGVQVYGLDFSANSGYDVGNYDINPFDNISYGPEGRPTYDPALLDAIYESEYVDPFLGTRPTDVNVSGGEYIDVFSSYAPEELVPGSEFDTLDFRVYTNDGDSAHTGPDFRIFQDMRGVQAVYRITPETTTTLTQALGAQADVIYVADAGALGEPGLSADFNTNITYDVGDVVMYAGLFYEAIAETIGNLPTDNQYWTPTAGAANIWGMLTVNGERIMYRYRDTVANTVSGLLRGTAGTAITDHAINSLVYDIGRGNLLPASCQDYIDTNITYPLVSGVNLGDGSTVAFTAADINVSQEDSSVQDLAVQVFVGGERVQTGYELTNPNPVTVTFDTAPPDGVEVAILVRRGHDWYNPLTPNLPLSQTNTPCARFLRGEI